MSLVKHFKFSIIYSDTTSGHYPYKVTGTTTIEPITVILVFNVILVCIIYSIASAGPSTMYGEWCTPKEKLEALAFVMITYEKRNVSE